jgi:hypothetical protein
LLALARTHPPGSALQRDAATPKAAASNRNPSSSPPFNPTSTACNVSATATGLLARILSNKAFE